MARSDRSSSWLAFNLGLHRSTVSKWLNEHTRPHNFEIVNKIADILLLSEEERIKLIKSAGYDYLELESEKKTRFVELRNVLATLYPDQRSAWRIATDAGLEQTNLKIKGSATDNWHEILNEATKQAKISELLEIVEQEYGTNRTLQRAIAEYNQTVPQEYYFPHLVSNKQVVESGAYYRNALKELPNFTSLELKENNEASRKTKETETYSKKSSLTVELRIERDIFSFSQEEQQDLLEAIKSLLSVQGEIKIVHIKPG